MKKIFLLTLILLTSNALARKFYIGYSDDEVQSLSKLEVIKNYPLLQIAIVEAQNEETLSNFDFVSRPPIQIFIDGKRNISTSETLEPVAKQWNYNKINLKKAWRYTRGKGAKVLILDSGVDKNHPALSNNIKEIIDFTKSKVTTYVPYPGFDITGHGTHIAGVIAGNGHGFTGIAPEAEVYIGKVCIFICRDQTILVDAFEWAIEKKVDIISMSFSNTTFPELIARRIFEKIEAHNIVAVAASGNEGNKKNIIGFPAKYETVLSVGATDSLGAVADFSNFGKELSLVAPGVDIESTSLTKGINSTESLLTSMTGTSMATPHVSAVAALLRSYRPNLSPQEVREFILKGAIKNDLYTKSKYGAGILDASHSLELAEQN